MPPPDLIVLPESPFTQLFDTNHAATSFERAQIIGLIERPMARLKELNNEIMRIKKVAEFLVAERSTVHRYIRSHQALLSPMRGLPAEILSEIFLHCLPLDRNPVRSMREPPLLFTRVCRRWRDVALNTPRLWTRIHIFIPQVHTLPRAEQKRIFEMRALGWETWLKRSGALPVSISLHVNWDDNPMPVLISNPSGGGGGTLGLAGGFAAADFTLLADFAQLLMTFSRRWRNLTLHIPLAILQLLAYTLSADDVPALEQIKLSYRPPLEILSITPLPEERKFSLSQLRLLETPSLRSLSLVSHLESPYSMQLQWSNLTDLDLQSQFFRGSIKLTECFGILDKACKLQRCAVTVGLSSPLEFVPSSLDASGALVLQPPEPNDLSLSHLLLELSLGKTIHLPDLQSLDINFILVSTHPPPNFQQLNAQAILVLPDPPLRLNDISYLYDRILAPRIQALRCKIGTLSSVYGTALPSSMRFESVPFLRFLERCAEAAGTRTITTVGEMEMGMETGSGRLRTLEKLDISMPLTDEGLMEALEMTPELKNLIVNEWPVRAGTQFRRSEAAGGGGGGGSTVGNNGEAVVGGGGQGLGRIYEPTTVSEGLLASLTWVGAGAGESSLSGKEGGDEASRLGSNVNVSPDSDSVLLPLCPKLEQVKFSNCTTNSGGTHNWNRSGTALEAAIIRFAESRAPVKSSASSSSSAPSAPVTRLQSLQVVFNHVSAYPDFNLDLNQTPGTGGNGDSASTDADPRSDPADPSLLDYATFKKRFSALIHDRGVKTNWVYPGKKKLNDSPWGGLPQGGG